MVVLTNSVDNTTHPGLCSSTNCGVSKCDLKTSTVRRPRLTRALKPLKKKLSLPGEPEQHG